MAHMDDAQSEVLVVSTISCQTSNSNARGAAPVSIEKKRRSYKVACTLAGERFFARWSKRSHNQEERRNSRVRIQHERAATCVLRVLRSKRGSQPQVIGDWRCSRKAKVAHTTKGGRISGIRSSLMVAYLDSRENLPNRVPPVVWFVNHMPMRRKKPAARVELAAFRFHDLKV